MDVARDGAKRSRGAARRCARRSSRAPLRPRRWCFLRARRPPRPPKPRPPTTRPPTTLAAWRAALTRGARDNGACRIGRISAIWPARKAPAAGLGVFAPSADVRTLRRGGDRAPAAGPAGPGGDRRPRGRWRARGARGRASPAAEPRGRGGGAKRRPRVGRGLPARGGSTARDRPPPSAPRGAHLRVRAAPGAGGRRPGVARDLLGAPTYGTGRVPRGRRVPGSATWPGRSRAVAVGDAARIVRQRRAFPRRGRARVEPSAGATVRAARSTNEGDSGALLQARRAFRGDRAQGRARGRRLRTSLWDLMGWSRHRALVDAVDARAALGPDEAAGAGAFVDGGRADGILRRIRVEGDSRAPRRRRAPSGAGTAGVLRARFGAHADAAAAFAACADSAPRPASTPPRSPRPRLRAPKPAAPRPTRRGPALAG